MKYKPGKMADYPSIDPRAFGSAYSVPQAIARLPVNLLRTSLVTRQPQLTQAAMMQYRSAMDAPTHTAPALMPQRMMYQQHKNDTGGVSRGNPRAPLSSAQTLSAAMRPVMIAGEPAAGTAGFGGLSAVSTVSLRLPEHVPTYAVASAAAARGAQVFPQPGATYSADNMGARLRPVRQPIAPPLEAYGTALAERQQMQAADDAFRASNAMRAVATTKEGIRKLLGF